MKLLKPAENHCLSPLAFIKSLTIDQRYSFFLQKHKEGIIDINQEALNEWINRKSVLNEENFKDMLQQKGYNIVAFSNAVNEDLNDYHEELSVLVEKEPWFTKLNEIFNQSFEKEIKYNKVNGYTYLIRPFILYANQQINENKKSNLLSTNAQQSLIETLATKLLRMSLKTFVLELNISKLKEEMEGDTSEERFHSFISQKGSKENLTELYNEYSVLAKTLLIQTEYFVNNTNELLTRIYDNKKDIINQLGISDDAALNKISFGEGDTHQSGRSVAILEFDDRKKIVYKPKRLQVEIAYNKLIELLNQDNNLLEMKTPKTLVFNDYTFEEFINATPCQTDLEVKQYYERFGQLLGLMYMVNANDMHMENVIASGAHPYIVDLETVFQTKIKYDANETAELKNKYKMIDFVSGTLLLPEKIIHNEMGDMIEFSALSGNEQVLTKQDYRLKNDFTDNAQYELDNLKIASSNNLVYLNTELMNYQNYVTEIIDGFQNVLLFFYNNKERLLQEDGIINQFKDLYVRIIARNTYVYAQLLNSTYHPDYMRDYYYFEQIIENLWSLPVKNKSIIESEYRDMMQGDIPIFFTKTTSLSLLDSENKELINITNTEGLSKVREKIKNLSLEDIKKQKTIIKIKTETAESVRNVPVGSFIPVGNENIDNMKVEFIEHAKKIGYYLAETATICEESKTMSWITVNDDENKKWDMGTVGGELYQGLSGISLFYHYLYKLTRVKEFKKYRDYSFNMATKNAVFLKYNSGLHGYASLLYPAIKVLDDGPGRKYKQGAQEAIAFLSDNTSKTSKGIDWMHGKSSVIELLMLFFEQSKDEEYLNLAISYALEIIKEVKSNSEVIELGGLSHGFSGLAVTFMKLGYLSEREDIRDYGMKFLQSDQSLYDESLNGWINKLHEEKKVSHYWCHGSVGIGLSRLKMTKYVDETTKLEIESDIVRATKSLNPLEPLKDDGLCHGNMAIVDYYLELYLYTKKIEHYNKALAIGNYVLKAYQNNDKYNLIEFEGFPPVGLFKGLSGIGYEYLRLAAPESVPSVLIFN